MAKMNMEQGLVNETESLIRANDPGFYFRDLEVELNSIPITEQEYDWICCRRSREGLFYWKFRSDKPVESGDMDNPSWGYAYTAKLISFEEVRRMSCFDQFRVFMFNEREDLARDLIECGRVSESFLGHSIALPPISEVEKKMLNGR